MIYKGEEIYARAYVPGSDLFEINDDGTLGKSLDIYVKFDEQIEVVWFETEVDDYVQHKTIDDARKSIDKELKKMAKLSKDFK